MPDNHRSHITWYCQKCHQVLRYLYGCALIMLRLSMIPSLLAPMGGAVVTGHTTDKKTSNHALLRHDSGITTHVPLALRDNFVIKNWFIFGNFFLKFNVSF